MRKKILVTITVLAVIAALAAVFTGAQFDKMATSNGNVLTFGNIVGTDWSPDPLVKEMNLVPGETRNATLYLEPRGTIPQDIYIGLQNQNIADPDAGFGDKVEVALQVDGNWLWGGNYKDVHELFMVWQLIKSNAPANTWITINMQIHVKTTLPSSFMGVTYNFKTLIDAVQVGGSTPGSIPYKWIAP